MTKKLKNKLKKIDDFDKMVKKQDKELYELLKGFYNELRYKRGYTPRAVGEAMAMIWDVITTME